MAPPLGADDFRDVRGYRWRVKPAQPASRIPSSRRTNGLAAWILAIPPGVTDVALAGALVLWTATASAGGGESAGATLLLAAGAMAVAVRTRWPLAVLLITLVPYVVTRYSGTGQPAVLVALYTVASVCSQRTAILATALAALSSVAAVAVHGASVGLAVGRVLEVVFAALLGMAVAGAPPTARPRDRHAHADRGRGRADAYRPGTPRRGCPPSKRDRRPGQPRGRDREARSPGVRSHAGDRRRGARGACRHAPGSRCAADRRRSRGACPATAFGQTRRAARARSRRRPQREVHRRGRSLQHPDRPGPDRLPHRPGGAHQHPAPRQRVGGSGSDQVLSAIDRAGDHRQRHRPKRERLGTHGARS